MRKTRAIAACAAGALLVGALSGCGASLDREVSVQGMDMRVPSNWVEHIENSSTSTEANSNNDTSVGGATDTTGAGGNISDNAALSASAAATTFSYTENNSKAKDDDTPNRIVVTCTPLADAPAQTAAEAIAVKQAQLEADEGVTAWDIEKEATDIIDGATATTYRYSFVKEIDGTRQKYTASVAYVVTADTFYEINVRGDAADVDGIVGSIEF